MLQTISSSSFKCDRGTTSVHRPPYLSVLAPTISRLFFIRQLPSIVSPSKCEIPDVTGMSYKEYYLVRKQSESTLLTEHELYPQVRRMRAFQNLCLSGKTHRGAIVGVSIPAVAYIFLLTISQHIDLDIGDNEMATKSGQSPELVLSPSRVEPGL
jgi:hypothetical protein